MAISSCQQSLPPSLSGTLKFVGLRPFDDEKRHWVALNTSIALQQLKDKKELHPRQEEELKRQTSITPKEAAVIKAISGHSIQTPHVPISPAVTTPSPRVTTPPAVEETDAGGVARQRSEVEPDFDARAAWRRAATLRKTELKPDLWKVAYKSIKDSVTAPRDQVNHVDLFVCLFHYLVDSIPRIYFLITIVWRNIICVRVHDIVCLLVISFTLGMHNLTFFTFPLKYQALLGVSVLAKGGPL